jgi:hypothetical protein
LYAEEQAVLEQDQHFDMLGLVKLLLAKKIPRHTFPSFTGILSTISKLLSDARRGIEAITIAFTFHSSWTFCRKNKVDEHNDKIRFRALHVQGLDVTLLARF